jgi:hypothetical protein
MKTRHIFSLLIGLLLVSVMQIAGQTPAPQMPPPVLSIIREEIKAGRNAAHEKVETGYVQAMVQAKWPVYWLGMTAATGTNEAWFLTGYPSFAALEKDRQDAEKNSALMQRFEQLEQQDSEFRMGQRLMAAVLRKDLSYHPERLMPSLPKARYFDVLTVRMWPGQDMAFGEAVKLYLDALEKAKIEGGSATYQVISGAPGGTFLVFMPVKSLAELDAAPAQNQAINAAFGAVNGPKFLKLMGESFQTIESTMFTFSPKMSYVSKEFAAADPDFWTPKPKATAKAPAPKKQIAKTQ